MQPQSPLGLLNPLYDPLRQTRRGSHLALAEACTSDSQMPGLCTYLQACKSGTIKAVCNAVVPSIPLRIALVVGGTILSLAFVTLVVMLNSKSTILREKHTVSAQGAAFGKSRLEAEEQHFNDVFL